jgi:phosphoribosylglycinamide formyltransferase-1
LQGYYAVGNFEYGLCVNVTFFIFFVTSAEAGFINLVMNKKARIAVFASGGGSNAEEIFKYFRVHPAIEIALVLTNNPQALVIERAKKAGLPAIVFGKGDFADAGKVLGWLHEKNVTHIVLAGFLWLIPDFLIRAFPDKIVNIHPALLPKFGGKGMYGDRVHAAVKQSGEKYTGLTIHLVNERYDEGKILYQAKCEVANDDTPSDIARKVLKLEHACYAPVIEGWILDKLPLSGKLESASAF